MSDSLHVHSPFKSDLPTDSPRAITAKGATLPINSSISKDRTAGKKAKEDANLRGLTVNLDRHAAIQKRSSSDSSNKSLEYEGGDYPESQSESESEGESEDTHGIQNYAQTCPPTPPPVDTLCQLAKTSSSKGLGKAPEEHQDSASPTHDTATAATRLDKTGHPEAVDIEEWSQGPSKVYHTCARRS